MSKSIKIHHPPRRLFKRSPRSLKNLSSKRNAQKKWRSGSKKSFEAGLGGKRDEKSWGIDIVTLWRGVMWCNFKSCVIPYHLHASVWRRSLVNEEKGFCKHSAIDSKEYSSKPHCGKTGISLLEGNFHFFLLPFDWRQWLTLQNHQDAPLVRTFQESVWDGAVGLWKPVGEAGYGRMESKMSSKCVQKRISVGSVIIWYHLYILAIGRWISDWATPFFSSAAQDVRYYRRESAVFGWTDDGIATILLFCSTEWHYPFAKRQPQDSRQCWWLSPQRTLALFCSWVKFWKQRIWMDWIAEVAEVEYLNQNQSN